MEPVEDGRREDVEVAREDDEVGVVPVQHAGHVSVELLANAHRVDCGPGGRKPWLSLARFL
jgi:hypothetical protein